MFPNEIGYPAFVIDLWHSTTDTRVGWCFSTLRNDRLEVEDFFVRPEYKSGGHMQKLVSELYRLAEINELPVRFWVPFADTSSKCANFSVVNDLIRMKKLRVRNSGVTWAAYWME
jgi:GNAT superfamily N-acetyltransferase